ncbi:MAG TPA: type II toxin-antitoxin system HicB family antitoxin [Rhizomicrobium sp.]|nr:type II toxin-antitoxin system HicB family antitoxin [Rhizomicrobium sp.]
MRLKRKVHRYIALIDGKAGAYGVTFPDLPGCAAMGKTMDDALSNAAEALRDWAAVTEEGGGKVPRPHNLEALRRDPQVKAVLASGAGLATVPLVRETGKPVKANLSIDSGVLAAMDEEAQRRSLTHSAFVEMLVGTMLTKVA